MTLFESDYWAAAINEHGEYAEYTCSHNKELILDEALKWRFKHPDLRIYVFSQIARAVVYDSYKQN